MFAYCLALNAYAVVAVACLIEFVSCLPTKTISAPLLYLGSLQVAMIVNHTIPMSLIAMTGSLFYLYRYTTYLSLITSDAPLFSSSPFVPIIEDDGADC